MSDLPRPLDRTLLFAAPIALVGTALVVAPVTGLVAAIGLVAGLLVGRRSSVEMRIVAGLLVSVLTGIVTLVGPKGVGAGCLAAIVIGFYPLLVLAFSIDVRAGTVASRFALANRTRVALVVSSLTTVWLHASLRDASDRGLGVASLGILLSVGTLVYELKTWRRFRRESRPTAFDVDYGIGDEVERQAVERAAESSTGYRRSAAPHEIVVRGSRGKTTRLAFRSLALSVLSNLLAIATLAAVYFDCTLGPPRELKYGTAFLQRTEGPTHLRSDQP